MFRKAYPDVPVVFVDAGDFTGDPTVPGQKLTDALIDGMNRMGYAVAAAGTRELNHGWDVFVARRTQAKFPLVSANLVWQDTGEPIVDPYVVQKIALRRGAKAKEVRVAFTGLVMANPAFLKPGPGGRRIAIADPVTSAAKYVPQMKAKADVVVVLSALELEMARNVARKVKEIDLILGAFGGIQSRSDDFPEDSLIGRTRVQYVGDQAKNLGEVRMSFTDKKAVASVQRAVYGLTREWPEDPDLAALMASTKDAINEYNKSQAVAESPFSASPAAAPADTPVFTGSERCRPCHETEYGIWSTSAHARAFDILVKQHQDYNPRCVSCHVIGFGKPQGFVNAAATPGLINVGCESCHGPSSRHPESVVKGFGATTTQECRNCHTAENSPDFNPAIYIPKVRHWAEPRAASR